MREKLPIAIEFYDLCDRRSKDIIKEFSYELTYERLLARIYLQGFLDCLEANEARQ